MKQTALGRCTYRYIRIGTISEPYNNIYPEEEYLEDRKDGSKMPERIHFV
jgi:hypothetical protein